MAYMDYMDPDVLYPQKADKLNLSLSCQNIVSMTHWPLGDMAMILRV